MEYNCLQMQKNNKIAFPHGIMFHHFHNEKYYKGQGSISGATFYRILDFVGNEKNLLSANDFFRKAINQNLELRDVS